MLPKVSIIVTTYFRNDKLRQALNSIQKLEYPNLQTIVVDDSGVSNAASVAADFNVEYIANDQNKGPVFARNRGFDRSQGDFVQFLDDDDLLIKGSIRKNINHFRKFDQNVGVIYSGFRTEGRGDVFPDPEVSGNILKYPLMADFRGAVLPALIIRSDVLEKIFPMITSSTIEDTELKIELAQQTEFQPIQNISVKVRDSPSSRGKKLENFIDMKKLTYRYSNLYDKYENKVEKTLLSNAYRHKAITNLRVGDRKGAVHGFLMSAYHRPSQKYRELMKAILVSIFLYKPLTSR